MSSLILYTMKKFLEVPFDRKEEVKKVGCKFDKEKKRWYYDDNVTPNDELIDVISEFELIYVSIPYDKKDICKTLGGKWSPETKQWFTYKGNKEFFKQMSTN